MTAAGFSAECPYNPMVPPHRDDPFPYFRWARDNAPIVFHPTLNAYLVTRYDTVRSVAGCAPRFSSNYSLPLHIDLAHPEVAEVLAEVGDLTAVLVELDGEEHEQVRAVWQRLLHGPRLNRMRRDIEAMAENLLDECMAHGQADLAGDFAEPLVQAVIGTLLGIPPAERDLVYQFALAGLTWSNPLLPLPERVAAAHRHVAAYGYFRSLYERVRADPRDDIVSMLATIDDLPRTPFSFNDFVSTIRVFYGAGIDTTRDAITATVWTLLSEGLWSEAAANRSILMVALEEALRRDAPHRGLMRTATEDVELDGVFIPSGARLLLLFGSANRDERRFTDPDSFDLTRADVRDHLAFGYGAHRCVGANLARTEARIALEALARRFPQLAAAPDFEPIYRPSFFFRGLQRLDVKWDNRANGCS